MENNENLNNQVTNDNVQSEITNNQLTNDNVQSEITNNQVTNDNVQPEITNNQVIENNNQIEDNKQVNVVDANTQNPKNNNILIVLIALLLIGVGGYLIYTKIFAKEESKGNNEPTPTPLVTPEPSSTPQVNPTSENVITKMNEHKLSNNKTLELQLNGKAIRIKNTNGKLYYNDKFISEVGSCYIYDDEGNFDGEEEKCSRLYETDKFILITYAYQFIEYPYIINEKGELIKVKQTTDDTGSEGIEKLQLENGKLVALEVSNEPDDDKKVEFVYEVDKMTIKYVE